MVMSPEQFREWRKNLGLKQRDAAELLGLKKRMIQYYETGVRDGKKVKIPRYIRLACYALTNHIRDFDGEHVTERAPSPEDANGSHPKAKHGAAIVDLAAARDAQS